MFLGQNGEWWDFWLIVAVVIAALSAIAVGITTSGSLVAHKREAVTAEDDFRKYKLSTEQRISDANARAAEAKLALEKFKAPRSILNKFEFVEAIKPFAGIPYDIGIQAEDEPLHMLDELTFVLIAAGWSWKDAILEGLQFNAPGKPLMKPIILRGGVEVRYSTAKAVEWGKAAEALVNALNAAGLTSIAKADANSPQNAIHINIGTKPRD